MTHWVQYFYVMPSVTSKFIAAKFTGNFFDLLVVFDRITHFFLVDILPSFGAFLLLVYLLFYSSFLFSLLCFIIFFHKLIIFMPRSPVLFSSLAILRTMDVIHLNSIKWQLLPIVHPLPRLLS